MAVPAVIAFKEKDDIMKFVVYAIAGIAILYLLYKLFGMFREIGEKLEEGKDKLSNALEAGIPPLGLYETIAKPVTPADTAKVITEHASKNPDKPYLVEKSIYDALKEQGYKLPSNVKPYSLEESMKESPVKVERKTSTIGSKLGLWDSKKESSESGKVVPRYITQKEYQDIQAKRWEAIAKYYQNQEKRFKPLPMPAPHILPIRRDFRAL